MEEHPRRCSPLDRSDRSGEEAPENGQVKPWIVCKIDVRKNNPYAKNARKICAKFQLFFSEVFMRSFRKELWLEVPARRGFIHITPMVLEALIDSGISEGFCLVNAMHITALVFINDNESGLHRDFERWLEKLAPEKPHS